MKGGFDGVLEGGLKLGIYVCMYVWEEGEKRGGVLLAAKRAITSNRKSHKRDFDIGKPEELAPGSKKKVKSSKYQT